MGYLFDFEHRDDIAPPFTRLTFNVPRDVGELAQAMSLRERDALYQKVLDTIRRTACTASQHDSHPDSR